MKKKDLLQIGIGIILVFVFLFSGYQIVRISSDYSKSDALYEDTKNSFVKVVDSKDDTVDSEEKQTVKSESMVDSEEVKTESTVAPKEDQQAKKDSKVNSKGKHHAKKKITVDFEGLQKINEDIVGWIHFENEDISYPVLYSGDNSKYLRTAYDGEELTAGSIFVAGNNQPDFSDPHTIIYGHNMRNLSMFGKLKYYREKKNYYKNHKYFQIITPEAKYRYQIFSYREVKTDSKVYTTDFANSDAFKKFVDDVLITDESKCSDIHFTGKSKIITLSTCSADDKRFVVNAVCVGESN